MVMWPWERFEQTPAQFFHRLPPPTEQVPSNVESFASLIPAASSNSQPFLIQNPIQILEVFQVFAQEDILF